MFAMTVQRESRSSLCEDGLRRRRHDSELSLHDGADAIVYAA